LPVRNCALTESISYNTEFNELFRKTHAVLTILAQQELPPKLWPNSSTKKLVMVNAILKHRRVPKLPSSFFGATNLERLNFDSLNSLVRLTCQEEVKTNCVRHHGGEQ
jgi:hypothetical protein